MASSSQFRANVLVTPDGAELSFHSIGEGPGILIVHGAACHGMTHRELAILLAGTYTVHLLSRRNRGLSGNYPRSILQMEAVVPLPQRRDQGGLFEEELDSRTYSQEFSRAVMETDLSDIGLVIEKTGSAFVLGVSVGAILALASSLSPEIAPAFASVRKVVIFEPPLQFSDLDTGLDVKGARKYENQMAAGDLPGAMLTAMNLVQQVPGWIPGPIMRFMANLMIRSQSKSPEEVRREGNTTMAQLAPILRYEFAVVEYMVGDSSRFEMNGGERQILLLGGANSPAYTKIVADRLEKVIKGAQRITIQGVGHEVLCNRDFRGKPGKAVRFIQEFFK